jgi:hypothetical protein
MGVIGYTVISALTILVWCFFLLHWYSVIKLVNTHIV